MYVRQMKQFIRTARPDFDERRYGSILDLMRACQKDGLLRLERDRQGGLRVFASGTVKPPALRPGWSTIAGPETDSAESSESAEASESADSAREEAPAPPPPALPPHPDEEPEDTRGNVPQAAESKPRAGAERPRRNQERRAQIEEPGTTNADRGGCASREAEAHAQDRRQVRRSET